MYNIFMKKIILIVMVMSIVIFTVACPEPYKPEPEPEPDASDIRFDQPENVEKNFYYIYVNYFNNKLNTIQVNFRTDLINFQPRTNATITDWRYEIMNGDNVLLEVNKANYTELFTFDLNPGSETRDMVYDITPSVGRIRFRTDKSKTFSSDPFRNKDPEKVRINVSIVDDYGASYNIETTVNITDYQTNK